MDVKIMPAGDAALVVEFGDIIDENVNAQVHALARKIEEQHIEGIMEVVPTFRSVLVQYDVFVCSYSQIRDVVHSLADTLNVLDKTAKKIVKIPCCYGARFGQDLSDMEKLTGLDRDEIIAIHSATDYKIYMLGFLPGFVYLGGLDKRIEVPRLKTPRVKIRKGAVGIGGNQTGIYPMDSPGGWQLMGLTPVKTYDPDREVPILVEAGDYIRFVPVDRAEYDRIKEEVEQGTYQVRVVEGEV